jgi:hypothetical protein
MNYLSKKSLKSVSIEAVVVGILLIAVVKFVQKYLLDYIPNISGKKTVYELLFVSGFLFHIACEYTGINVWYSKEYCKLLTKPT